MELGNKCTSVGVGSQKLISLQNTFNRKTEEEKVIEDERRKEASGSVPPHTASIPQT